MPVGPQMPKPPEGGFGIGRRNSSGATGSRLSLFCGSSVVSRNVPVLGFSVLGFRFWGLRGRAGQCTDLEGGEGREKPGAMSEAVSGPPWNSYMGL